MPEKTRLIKRREIYEQVTDRNFKIVARQCKAAEKDLRLYLVKRFSDLIGDQNFIDALPGQLPPDAASQARTRHIIQLLRNLSVYIRILN